MGRRRTEHVIQRTSVPERFGWFWITRANTRADRQQFCRFRRRLDAAGTACVSGSSRTRQIRASVTVLRRRTVIVSSNLSARTGNCVRRTRSSKRRLLILRRRSSTARFANDCLHQGQQRASRGRADLPSSANRPVHVL